jgi:hypothetical protein
MPLNPESGEILLAEPTISHYKNIPPPVLRAGVGRYNNKDLADEGIPSE